MTRIVCLCVYSSCLSPEHVKIEIYLNVWEVAVLKILPQLGVRHESVILCSNLDSVLHVQLPVVDPTCSLHIINSNHEKVSKLERRFGSLQICLHLPIGVVDDGEEHVQQDKEYEEDVGKKKYRSPYVVRLFYGNKIEVPQDGSKESKSRLRRALVIRNLNN